MITEKGTVKVTTELNDKLYKELNRPSLILGIIYIVLGGALLLAYLSTVFIEDYEEATLDVFFLAVGAVLLVFGIMLVCVQGKLNKIKGVQTKVEEHEFFSRLLYFSRLRKRRAFGNG